MAVQFPDDRRVRGELKCGVIDVGPRFANDFKEFSHEAETVRGSVEKCSNVSTGG